jgi:hypothetical protein
LPQGLIIRMLQLASAANAKMLAWRIDMVRAAHKRTICAQQITRYAASDMPPIGGYAIAARSNPDNF